jgi:hypothetical protein
MFQGPGVVVEGELEVEAVAQLLDLRQVGQQWGGILCPEYDCINLVGKQRNLRDLIGVEGIFNLRKSLSQAAHKPLGVEGGYICAAGGAYDHYSC